jgi:hypothetical protein
VSCIYAPNRVNRSSSVKFGQVPSLDAWRSHLALDAWIVARFGPFEGCGGFGRVASFRGVRPGHFSRSARPMAKASQLYWLATTGEFDSW